MRRIVLLLASVALTVGVLFSAAFYAPGGGAGTQTTAQTAQPNIVYILTDDMRKDDLKYMPKTRSVLQNEGMTFANAFVSNPVCCPSRATIMRGQYSHNTGVWTNTSTDSPSTASGGWQAYKDNGGETDNVATRLHDAGYKTALLGKYLNGYTDTDTYVPPGWDKWFATQNGFFDYHANDNGTIRYFGTNASDYQTDVLSRQTNGFISDSASQDKPFFAYVSPKAPHVPAIPAPRHEHTYDGAKAPRPPSFNEKDVSDKPHWISQLSLLGSYKKNQIDSRHEKRIESLQAVDDLVAGVVNTLNNAGVMSNTYIFFTSDNGWQSGEHRIPFEKKRPYEESIRVPLLVRGPGAAASSTTNKLALNTDFLPTFTSLAGTQTPSYVDGRSLQPVLKGIASSWRNAILLEGAEYFNPAFSGIRTQGDSYNGKYIEYQDGVRERYYLGHDPHELTNQYDRDSPPRDLVSGLQALKSCAQDTCRAAENGP